MWGLVFKVRYRYPEISGEESPGAVWGDALSNYTRYPLFLYTIVPRGTI